MTPDIVADFVIVGAGSAGCVIANRLSADTGTKVLLLEAGGDDRPWRNLPQFLSNLNIHIPAGFSKAIGDPKIGWGYVTAPDPSTDERVQALPRGKVLGGSSSINGMMYVRGLPSDFDGWRERGCTGWGWDEVRPLFLRSQNSALGAGPWHAVGGPLSVEPFPEKYAAIDAFIEASREAGLPRSADLNAEVKEGVCYVQQNTRRGVRQSSAAAFLHPVRKRTNLRVELNCLVAKIDIESGRASGVHFEQHGRKLFAKANAEVIVCAGAINSPQLLELSGIGDAAALQARGITPLVALPAVGENFQDHYMVAIQTRLRPGVPSINERSRGLPFLRELSRYVLRRRGILAITVGSAIGYIRSSPDADPPDVQLVLTPGTIDYARSAKTGGIVLEDQPGFTCGGYTMRPSSRGSVHIVTADPAVAPIIRPNYLSATQDQITMINQVRAMRRLLEQPSMRAIVAHELPPLSDVANDDDEGILRWARQTGFTAHHAVGTCRMGADADSVTDPRLRVRGVEGLRVADASIMPCLVSANTHAASVMIGEKASDLIRGEGRN